MADTATDALIDSLAAADNTSRDARRLLQRLTTTGPRTLERSLHLLQLLSSGTLPPPTTHELLSFLPQLIGESEDELTALVDALKELIANDRTLMLPAIGALGEVRLTETLRPELAKLAFGALPLADEGDVPTLARVLLESAAGAPAARQLRSSASRLAPSPWHALLTPPSRGQCAAPPRLLLGQGLDRAMRCITYALAVGHDAALYAAAAAAPPIRRDARPLSRAPPRCSCGRRAVPIRR